MHVILRILIVIPAGFIAACVGAAMVLFLSQGVTSNPGETGDFLAKVFVLSLVAAIVVGAVTGVPVLVLIVLAEFFGWRSLILHLLLGGGLGLAMFMLGVGGSTPEDVQVGVASGATGGFLYWLVAGRNAGRRRRQPVISPE